MLCLWSFCYSIVGLEDRHIESLKESMKMNDWIIRVEEENEIDKMFWESLKGMGAKEIKFGVKGCATKLSDKIIIGNYIAEITYPNTFRKIWALQNRLPKSLAEFNIAKHMRIMRLPEPKMQVIVTKNRKMAEEYRKEYLELNQ